MGKAKTVEGWILPTESSRRLELLKLRLLLFSDFRLASSFRFDKSF